MDQKELNKIKNWAEYTRRKLNDAKIGIVLNQLGIPVTAQLLTYRVADECNMAIADVEPLVKAFLRDSIKYGAVVKTGRKYSSGNSAMRTPSQSESDGDQQLST